MKNMYVKTKQLNSESKKGKMIESEVIENLNRTTTSKIESVIKKL